MISYILVFFTGFSRYISVAQFLVFTYNNQAGPLSVDIYTYMKKNAV